LTEIERAVGWGLDSGGSAFVLVRVFALMTKVEALVLAEVMRDAASERGETEERKVLLLRSSRRQVQPWGEILVSPRRKSCIVSLTDVGLGVRMTASLTVIMTGGEMS
jgi:hypothetical protein